MQKNQRLALEELPYQSSRLEPDWPDESIQSSALEFLTTKDASNSGVTQATGEENGANKFH
ncbi:hypothetical protein OAG63_01145 [Methylacidiphilales bacterium]|nr:hypothetical protein [Candidatus Methylacidiphilales bacterium]